MAVQICPVPLIKIFNMIELIIIGSLLYILHIYIKQMDKEEWNNGICPHCDGGVWKTQDNKEYTCSNCKRKLFKF